MIITIFTACGPDADDSDLVQLGAPEALTLNLSDPSNLWFCPEIHARAGTGTLTLVGYDVSYDWGEDLADLRPTAAFDYSDVITVSVPAGSRYTFCAVLVPLEVVEAIKKSAHWLGDNASPTSFDATVSIAGHSQERAIATGATIRIDVGFDLP